MPKKSLEEFISDIDTIISGEPVTASISGCDDEEYKELISLARLLVEADYDMEIRGSMERIWSRICKKGELEDDDLDMVAGGINVHGMLTGEYKKNGK